MMKCYDIVLFAKFNFHFAGLKPVSDELDNLGIDHLLTSKRHQIYDMFDEKKKKFKIAVIADEWGNLFREQTEILLTIGHSVANKNTTLNARNQDMDYICVPSQYYKNAFISRNIAPRKEFLITGYPYADKIFNQTYDKDSWWYRDLSKKKLLQKNILICPTYNRELNLVEDFSKSVFESKILEPFYQLFHREKEQTIFRFAFKPHPVLPKKYPEMMEQIKMAQIKYGEDFFHYHEDSHSDIADAILWSDAVIGDCSGAILLSTAKSSIPILAFDNSMKNQSGYYDKNGPEWTLRDEFAYRFDDMNSFPDLLKQVIENDPLEELRILVKNLIYGEYQGTAAKQIAKSISAIL